MAGNLVVAQMDVKELIRQLIWPIAVLNGGEFAAEEGTLKYKFLNWLYGPPDEIESK